LPTAVDLQFSDPRLFVVLAARWDAEPLRCAPQELVAIVKGFRRHEDGQPGPVEATGLVAPGMVLAGINGVAAAGVVFASLFERLKSAMARPPISLRFSLDPDYVVSFEPGAPPSDVVVTCFPGGVVVVTQLLPGRNPAQDRLGALLDKGDVVSAVNGRAVPLAGNFSAVVKMLKETPRPMSVSFSRAGRDRDDEAVFDQAKLGVVLFRTEAGGNAAFKAFAVVPGPAKATGRVAVGHVLLSVNGSAPPDSEAAVHGLLRDDGAELVVRLRDMAVHEEALKGLRAAADEDEQVATVGR
jgi:hypothetical protein